MKFIILFLFLTPLFHLNAQQLEITPTYHSIGVKVTNVTTADSCKTEYKKSNESNWWKGFNPDKVTISGVEQFRGSLFQLEENTSYDIRVSVYTGLNFNILPVAQVVTKFSPTFSSTANVKWVSPNGVGNTYNQANPGNLQTLFSSGQVTCGTTIFLTDGTYSFTDGLALTLNNHCTETTPIVLMAAPGANPIVDGGQKITSSWSSHPTIPNLYSTSIPTESEYSNTCVMGNMALYPYPTVNPDIFFYNLVALNFGFDGFVRDGNTIWIKTNSGTNPNNETVTVSKSFRFLTVYGNNKSAFLKIKGITFKNFGKPVLNGFGSSQDSYSAIVFDLRNVHHTYFEDCNFSYNTNHINYGDQCNHFLIQNCTFKHDVGKWSHAMIKKSHDKNFFSATSRGRAVESPAISVYLTKQGVVRNNYFDGLNSGIESSWTTGFNEDMDIYNNTFVDNYDAIECDGLWSNLRVWNNEIIRPMSGISAAPPAVGPRYFFRNTFHGIKGRNNTNNDAEFWGCNPIGTEYKLQGIGIKTNTDDNNLTPGNLYFFNNTFHAEDTLGYVITSWKSEWRKAVFINNAYSHKISNPFFYFDLANKSKNGAFQISSINENYFSYNPTSPIALIKYIHGEPRCTGIQNANALQSTLSSISGSPNIVIQNPMQKNPSFSSLNIGGFELNSNSPLIDAGLKIQGFYDFKGNSPDIGAKESNISLSTINTDELNDLKIYPNPAAESLKIEFPNLVDNVSFKIYNIMGQVVLNSNSISKGQHKIDITPLIDGLYYLEIYFNDSKKINKFIKIGH
jgi:hypothetical protein